MQPDADLPGPVLQLPARECLQFSADAGPGAVGFTCERAVAAWKNLLGARRPAATGFQTGQVFHQSDAFLARRCTGFQNRGEKEITPISMAASSPMMPPRAPRRVTLLIFVARTLHGVTLGCLLLPPSPTASPRDCGRHLESLRADSGSAAFFARPHRPFGPGTDSRKPWLALAARVGRASQRPKGRETKFFGCHHVDRLN